MSCLVALIALAAPRLAIVLVVIFSDVIGRSFDSNLVAFLGFLFMPLTTLAYTWSKMTYGEVTGVGLVLVIIAVLADLGILGSTRGSTRRRGD